MSYRLDKPYTQFQENEFIVNYNRKRGMVCKETQTALYALEAWEDLENDQVVSHKEEWNAEQLELHRQAKLKENEQVRDAFLLDSVTYKDIAWDSDNDQKLNLSYMIEHFPEDTDTVVWFAADGMTKLDCTKIDLQNILILLVTKTTYVWQQRNPELKIAITKAGSISDLDTIEISYELPDIDLIETEEA